MKYIIYALLWLAMAGCAASAQAYKVYKLYAYSQVHLPGNISTEDASEENLNKRNYIYTVYIETNSKKLPLITAAWINGVSYEAAPLSIPENKVAAGVSQKNGKQVVIQPAKGRYIYKVEFQPAEVNRKLPAGYQNKASGKILLQLRLNGKDSLQTTGPIEMLEPTEMY